MFATAIINLGVVDTSEIRTSFVVVGDADVQRLQEVHAVIWLRDEELHAAQDTTSPHDQPLTICN